MTAPHESGMDRLLNSVAALARQVSQEKAQSIAARIRQTTPNGAISALSVVVGTSVASKMILDLVDAWRAEHVSAGELASMLQAASHVVRQASEEQSVDLVWTGPTTPFVSARRTEQALLQVINTAEQTLFITSFVAYDVSTIVKALNVAAARGVVISMLIELSQEQGGSISFDALGEMNALVPSAKLYAWREKTDQFLAGRVHAKVAVADGRMCFITSANLTGYAMEKNMEAGVLITGGEIPKQLGEHLAALVFTNLVTRV